MLSKKNKNNSISQGYSKYNSGQISESKSQLDSPSQKAFETNVDNLKYSKGIFGFIFIFLLSTGAFLLAFLYGKKGVIDSLTIGSGIGFFLCCAWFVTRQSFGLKMKYSGRRFFDYLTFKEKRKEKNMVNLSYAVNNIESFEDYERYDALKKRNSTLSFYISIGFFTLFFIICIILSLTVK